MRIVVGDCPEGSDHLFCFGECVYVCGETEVGEALDLESGVSNYFLNKIN